MTRSAFVDSKIEERFRTDGYVVLDLLTHADVDGLLQIYDGFREIHEHEFTPTALLDDLEVRATIHDRVGAILAERILPVLDDYTVAVGSYAVKGASSRYSSVGLHQDLVFVDEHVSDQVGISLWCPLVEVNRENGCLGVVWGSHTLNNNFREPSSLPYRDLIDVIEDEYLTYLPMQPGQVLLMDNRLFHGSEANRSDQARVVAAGIAVPRESALLYCHRDYEGDERSWRSGRFRQTFTSGTKWACAPQKVNSGL